VLIFCDDIAEGGDYASHRYKYTSQMYDYLTGLYYYGARYYDPEMGRFTQADTMVPRPLDGQAFNRYSYALNSPLGLVDPSGHSPQGPYSAQVYDESSPPASVPTQAGIDPGPYGRSNALINSRSRSSTII